jgi:hypothetical protein
VNNEFYVRGPLILFPLNLEYKQEGKLPGWYIVFPEDRKPILNRALMEAIRKKEGPSLTDSFSDEMEDLFNNIEDGKEIEGNKNAESVFVTGLIRLLKENEFPLGYTSSNLDKISIFNPLTVISGKVSINEVPIENEKLHLEGIFPQTDSAIYGDYVDLLKNAPNMGNQFGIIGTLLDETSLDYNTPNKSKNGHKIEPVVVNLDEISADELNLAMESDASQDSVVVSSQSSQCTVVRGPPGTGKSQVIVNLISNALAKGQKVLLVCQKKYALDVVFSRLDKIGLSRHVAVLKDVQTGRAPLYKKLSSLLESKDISDDLNLLNIKFKHISQEIDKIVGQQSRLIAALKDRQEVGVSINKLYTLARPKSNYASKLDLPGSARDVKYYELPELLEPIKNLESGCKNFDNIQYPWKHRTDFSKLGSNNENIIIKIE